MKHMRLLKVLSRFWVSAQLTNVGVLGRREATVWALSASEAKLQQLTIFTRNHAVAGGIRCHQTSVVDQCQQSGFKQLDDYERSLHLN